MPALTLLRVPISAAVAGDSRLGSVYVESFAFAAATTTPLASRQTPYWRNSCRGDAAVVLRNAAGESIEAVIEDTRLYLFGHDNGVVHSITSSNPASTSSRLTFPFSAAQLGQLGDAEAYTELRNDIARLQGLGDIPARASLYQADGRSPIPVRGTHDRTPDPVAGWQYRSDRTWRITERRSGGQRIGFFLGVPVYFLADYGTQPLGTVTGSSGSQVALFGSVDFPSE